MKNILITLILLVFSSYLTASKWNSISATQPTKIQVELENSNIETSTVRISVAGYFNKTVSTPLGEAQVIEAEGATPILEKGFPELPKVTASVIIPETGNTSIEIIHSTFVDYHNILVAPSKGNLTRDIDPASIPYEYGDIYETDAFWPQTEGNLRDPYIMRDFRGQTIIFYPFRYNPVTRTLRVYTELTIQLSKTDGMGINPLIRKDAENMLDADFATIYPSHFLNYGNTNRYDPVEEFGNYLIISGSDFITAMDPFIEWKKQMGYPVEIVDVASIGNAAAIKAFIQNYYDTKGVTFVLLVGDAPQVPTSSTSAGDSDVNYSYTAGNDHYPDLFVGRFSAENLDQLNTQVERTIEYEKTPHLDIDWFTICTGVASDQGPGDDGEYDYQHIRNIQTDLLNFTYTYNNELFDGSQGGNDAPGNPSPAQVADDVNAGTSIINYTGHGSNTSWGTSGFSNGDVNNLVNDNMLPFVWSVACVNGNFKNNTCFAEAWLRATNNGEPTGAIAFLGSTINQSWNPPMCAQDEMNDILVESYADNINRTFGALSYHGCMQMNDEYGAGGDEMTDTWTCFGDPSVMVRTAVPAEMTVTHDPILFIGANQLTVITDVEGARATLTRDGTILSTEIVEGGSVTLSFATLNSVGTATLTVTGFNYLPYIAEIEIIPADGPFIVLGGYTIDDELGNNNGHADYNELVRLNISLENLGVEDASEGTTSIETNDPYVTMTDNMESFGMIPAGESITLEDAFELLVSDEVPDQHKITVTLTSSSGDAEWESIFTITLNAPVVEIESLTIDDTENGNGNGQLDPGERATLTIHYTNTGHTRATDVNAYLEAQCGVVDVIDPNQVIPSISLLGGGNAVFEVTVDENSEEGLPAPLYNTIEFGGFMLDRLFNEKVTPRCEDFETGDFSAYNWQTDGDANWMITNLYPYQGLFSAKSGTVANGQSSEIMISYEVLSDETISFVRKVSSGSGDKLKFFINDVLQGEWSGTSGGWQTEEFAVSAGMKTFKWIYEKDGSGSSGADCAWLDNIFLPAEMTLTVWAGPEEEICEGSDAFLEATATDYESIEWQTQGTGTFNDNTILDPIYTPSADDIAAGFVVLDITATDNNSNTATDEVTLTFVNVPDVPPVPEGPDMVDPHEYMSTVYYTEGLEGVDEYQWYLEPAEAGEIISHGTQGIVIWNEDYSGIASISVAGVNSCGEGNTSGSLEVSIDQLTGIVQPESVALEAVIAPNPSDGHFSISLYSKTGDEVSVLITDLLGNAVKHDTGITSQDILRYDISSLPAGIYLLTVTSHNERLTKKILKY